MATLQQCVFNVWSGGSLQGQAGDAITPHRWEIRHIWPGHISDDSVRLGRVNPGCGQVGLVTGSCPGGTPSIQYLLLRLTSARESCILITKGRRDPRRDLGGSRSIDLLDGDTIRELATEPSCTHAG